MAISATSLLIVKMRLLLTWMLGEGKGNPKKLPIYTRFGAANGDRGFKIFVKRGDSGEATATHHATSDATSVLRGRVKMIIKLITASTSSTKTLPSGPVVPPLINGVPTGCVAKR